ncbi:hypothetical protein KUDE01_011581 [Dissostichus eleginoides]|uniref:Uncharacterized protein n=1 Tax=Dissostichus eleginoides TaxID=100907 RepID=A0AAD9FJS5_DISEL|nr:hypothetical protein KUDE01_011581 [Dissostichus eleginoides]
MKMWPSTNYTLATPSLYIFTGDFNGIRGYRWLMYKEQHSRVEEMHSQAEASSFPERVEAEASNVHSSDEHARCLSSTRERLPLAWAAFINTLAICCGQRFRLTTTTHKLSREGEVGRRC